MKKRGLGKGLSDLGVEALLMSDSTTVADIPEEAGLSYLPVDQLQPGRYQPRRHIDEGDLRELADSIQSQGIIQPIIVRKTEQACEIIAGERRWRAAQLIGLSKVPVVIREINDEAALAMSLIENIQRRDLNVIEEAMALQRLLQEFGMTHQDIAAAIGKSRTTVTNLLRLLNLNPDVRELLAKGDLDMGHARALLALEGDQQSAVANNIVIQRLSVRDTEALIRKIQQQEQPTTKTAARNESQELTDLATRLSQQLGVLVKIKQQRGGKGHFVINYQDAKQRDVILNHFKAL